ncbi:RanGTP-binding protein-domain-containing protein, partial [Syncephalis pseudoplumigaleata]
LRDRFETKLRIVTPAIDLVEIIAARGNTALESVLELTTALRRDMDRFARRLAADEEDVATRAASVARVTRELKALLARIEDAVPFLNLALTTSGANLGTSLPTSVSPSRLMQASSALADCARRFRDEGGLREEWVWPAFDLRFYRMFRGSIRPKSLKDSTWVMEMARCTGRVARAVVSTSDGLDYVYDLVLEEDFNDGLYHEELADQDAAAAGEVHGREWRIAVEEVERLYYSSSGRLLEIEGAKHPVLVLKRGAAAAGVVADPGDVEWFAIELYQEGDMVGDATDDEEEEEEEEDAAKPTAAAMIGTLSLLEFIVRLSALEVCLQRSHLEAPDEMINLFLRDDHVSKDSVEHDVTESNATPIGTPHSSARRARRIDHVGEEMSPHASPSHKATGTTTTTTPKRNLLGADAYATPVPANGKHVGQRKAGNPPVVPLMKPPKPPNFLSSSN